MLIGVVSDTHGNVESTRAAVSLLQSLEVERVLHCGDIGSSEIIRQFRHWPTDFVFGNTDYDRVGLQQAIEQTGLTCHHRFASLTIEGRAIAVVHGDDTRALDEACRSGAFDLVCHGHTHAVRQEILGRTLVLNPGALDRASYYSIATVDLTKMTATIVKVL